MPQDKTLLNFAVIGLGAVGQRHCQVISHLPGAKLSFICDKHHDTAAKVAGELNTSISGYDQILADSAVDAVVIALPSDLHAEYGIPAAIAGKHLVIEKPIDAQSSQGERLLEACKTSGVHCAVISQYRFSNGMWQLSEAIRLGKFDPIILARASIKWFRHDSYYAESNWRGRATGERGGVFINQAIHAFDALLWLLGPCKEVYSLAGKNRLNVMDTEDTAVAGLRFESGAVASIEASTWAAPGFPDTYEFNGPDHSARVEAGVLTSWYSSDDDLPPDPNGLPFCAELPEKLQLFYRQYLNILDAFLGRGELLVKPAESLAALKLVEQIYRSA